MEPLSPLKTIRQLMEQTPLLVDPDRDGPRFQNALAAVPTEKLQAFYLDLDAEGRRRFHYVANVCLGYESWSRLYKDLVLTATQARLSDRLEGAFAHKAAILQQREVELEATRSSLEEELMRLEGENLALRQENQELRTQLAQAQENHEALQHQQQQLLDLVERYQQMVQDLRRLLSRLQGGQTVSG
uniref:Uncharacterized protein n=1 Tax=Desulfobacca acetoxidans TaxID=60893 RepID=A0A7V4G6S7_9BACT